jgi:long-subunit fatty acid transport protein
MIHSPAALSRLSGFQIYISTNTSLKMGSGHRSPIDTLTGEPASSGDSLRSFDEQSFVAAQPQIMIASSLALAEDAVVIGLAAYNSQDSGSVLTDPDGDIFTGGQQGGNRYHGTDLLFAHWNVALAAALRITQALHVGMSISYVHSIVNYGFVRDAALRGGSTRDEGEHVALDDCGGDEPCNYGNDRAAEAIRVRGNADGLAFGAGVVVRVHPRVYVGAGYSSPVVGFGGEAISASGDAWIRRAPAVVDSASADPEIGDVDADLEGRGKIVYQLPHRICAGVTWDTTDRLILDLQLRWLTYQIHDQLDIQLTGAAFRDPPRVPDRIVHYRGFQHAFAGQVGAAYRLSDRLDLHGATMVMSSAIPQDAVSLTAVDNWKIDAFLALRWRIWRQLGLSLGYGIVFMPSVRVTDSVFHPSALVGCVDGGFDVDLPSCTEASEGRGLASTTGTYSQMIHRLGLAMSYSWR